MAYPSPDTLKRVPLSPSQETRLKNYLDFELHNSVGERKNFEDDLKEEIRLYEAVPRTPRKNFPWENASNLVVPVAASMVDTIFPRVYSTVFGVVPILTLEEKDGEYADNVKALEHLLEILIREEMRLPDVSEDWLLEGIVHGTSGVKVLWEEIKKNVKSYDEDGNIEKQKDKVVERGPRVYRTPLIDLIIPFYAKSIKESPWVAHRFRTYWARIKELGEQKKYQNVDSVQYAIESKSTDYVRKREEIEHTEPLAQEEYELHEIWMEFDVDNDGMLESLVVTYHVPTHTLLRVQYNPYWHMCKPFREFVYWPRHDRFYGMGIVRQIKDIQEEISTLHNQMIDNHTVGNTRMWEVVAGSTADRNFDGVAPGRKVRVDKLDEEIKPLELGSLIQFDSEGEQIALTYAQQRTGVSDFLSGTEGGGGRETATTTMVRIQEARTRFNWTLDSARGALVDLGWFVISLLQQFAEESDIQGWIGEEDTELVMELLELSEEDVRNKVGLSVTGSSASINKEAEKQNLIALIQLLQQQAMSFEMPMVQIILNPGAPPELKEYAMNKLQGMHQLFSRVLQTFDTRNTDEILGSLQALEQALEPEPGPPLGQPIPGGPPGAPGALGPPGMVGPGAAMGGGIPGGA